MKKIALSALVALSTLSFADEAIVTYMSKKDVRIYKSPSQDAALVKVIKAGEVFSGVGEKVNGFIPIIGGYIHASDIATVKKDAKNPNALVASEVDAKSLKELPVDYVGRVKTDKANVRSCAMNTCNIQSVLSKGDTVELVAKTQDVSWFKISNGGYISSSVLELGKRTAVKESTAVTTEVATKTQEEIVVRPKNTDKASVKVLPSEEKIELMPNADTAYASETNAVTDNTSTQEYSDALLAHSGELAKKHPTEALIKNLTKTATPLPVKIQARYARALDFPILNKQGDVYTDYTYVWIKIKDEEFVLGKREGKNVSQRFTINKRAE